MNTKPNAARSSIPSFSSVPGQSFPVGLLVAVVMGLSASLSQSGEIDAPLSVEESHSNVPIEAAGHSFFELASIPLYSQVDFLGDTTWTAFTLETVSYFHLPLAKVENRLVLDYMDFPRAIPGQPGNPFPEFGKDGQGIGDLLVGTFVHPKNEGKVHWGIGPVLTAPTASADAIGSGKWALGPGIHISTEVGRLTLGAFAWNIWSVGGASDRKNVNQFTAKPFFLYDLGNDWRVISIPLGVTSNWDAKSGQKWKVPLGGGLAKKISVGDQVYDFQAQAFYSAARPDKAPDWSLRFTLEILFGDH